MIKLATVAGKICSTAKPVVHVQSEGSTSTDVPCIMHMDQTISRFSEEYCSLLARSSPTWSVLPTANRLPQDRAQKSTQYDQPATDPFYSLFMQVPLLHLGISQYSTRYASAVALPLTTFRSSQLDETLWFRAIPCLAMLLFPRFLRSHSMLPAATVTGFAPIASNCYPWVQYAPQHADQGAKTGKSFLKFNDAFG